MPHIAAVVGASGYAGGELVRLIVAHPDLAVGPLVAGSKAGQRLADVHPGLVSLGDRILGSSDDMDLRDVDVVFLALPHGESARIADRLPPSVPIVDLGADHRFTSADDWIAFFATPFAGTWTYGLPELTGRSPIADATRVANPGCYATAIALAFAPLVERDLVDPADLTVVAASGTSGAGRSASERLLGSEVMGDLTPYKVGGTHQHTPEVVQTLSALTQRPVALSFTPVLAPMPRGILAVCSARTDADEQTLRAAFDSRYGAEHFVHVLPAGTLPHTAATAGTNAVHLQVVRDDAAGRVVVMSAIDNLGKGAAGQAVQNANLMLGLAETAGLSVDAVAP